MSPPEGSGPVLPEAAASPPPHAPAVPAGTAAWRLSYGAMLALLLVPFAVTEVPPVTDYPSHLARLLILARPDDPDLARMYEPAWSLIPNVAIDVIGPPLLRLLPPYVAGKLLLMLGLLLPVTGAVAYARALFGQSSYWSLGAGLVAYNMLFLMGFMNFHLAIGGALWVAAGWLRWRRRAPLATVAGAAVGAAAVFFCHVMGVLFLAALLGAAELARALAPERRRALATRATLGRLLALGAVFAAPALLYLGSGLSSQASGRVVWSTLSAKASLLFLPFYSYVRPLAALLGLTLVGAVAVGVSARRVRAPLSTLLVVVALLAVYAATPTAARGGAWIDARFPVMLGLMLFAGFAPLPAPPRVARAALACGVLVLLAKVGVVSGVWWQSSRDLAEFRRVIAAVGPGERVLVVDTVYRADRPEDADRAAVAGLPRSRRVGSHQSYWHLPALLVIERKASFPYLFAEPSQQPLRVREAYRASTMPLGRPESHALLSRDLSADEIERAPYLAGDWRARFDYVLVFNPGLLPGPAALPADLMPAGKADIAALFRVGRTSPARDRGVPS